MVLFRFQKQQKQHISHFVCPSTFFPEMPERLTALSRVQRKTLHVVQDAAFPYGLVGPGDISGAQKPIQVCDVERLNTRFTAETSWF